MRVIDNAGATTTARATASIAEYPAGSGVYAKTLVAPLVAGQYTILWDNGATTPGNVAAEDLLVTSTPSYVAPSGTAYTTVANLKASLGITVTTYDDDLAECIEAASRGVDGICDRWFWLDTVDVTRYYTPSSPSLLLPIDDLVSVTTLKTDTTGDQTFATTLTRNSDYFLEPLNAAVENPARPYTVARLNPYGQYWPPWIRSVQIVGKFGWPAVPAPVVRATSLLSAILHKRKDAVFGFAVAGVDTETAMRIAQTDPTIRGLLNPYMRLSI